MRETRGTRALLIRGGPALLGLLLGVACIAGSESAFANARGDRGLILLALPLCAALILVCSRSTGVLRNLGLGIGAALGAWIIYLAATGLFLIIVDAPT